MASSPASKVEHACAALRLEPCHQLVKKTRRLCVVPVRVQLVIVGGVEPGFKPF